jgi:hypothetical protein
VCKCISAAVPSGGPEGLEAAAEVNTGACGRLDGLWPWSCPGMDCTLRSTWRCAPLLSAFEPLSLTWVAARLARSGDGRDVLACTRLSLGVSVVRSGEPGTARTGTSRISSCKRCVPLCVATNHGHLLSFSAATHSWLTMRCNVGAR